MPSALPVADQPTYVHPKSNMVHIIASSQGELLEFLGRSVSIPFPSIIEVVGEEKKIFVAVPDGGFTLAEGYYLLQWDGKRFSVVEDQPSIHEVRFQKDLGVFAVQIGGERPSLGIIDPRNGSSILTGESAVHATTNSKLTELTKTFSLVTPAVVESIKGVSFLKTSLGVTLLEKCEDTLLPVAGANADSVEVITYTDAGGNEVRLAALLSNGSYRVAITSQGSRFVFIDGSFDSVRADPANGAVFNSNGSLFRLNTSGCLLPVPYVVGQEEDTDQPVVPAIERPLHESPCGPDAELPEIAEFQRRLHELMPALPFPGRQPNPGGFEGLSPEQLATIADEEMKRFWAKLIQVSRALPPEAPRNSDYPDQTEPTYTRRPIGFVNKLLAPIGVSFGAVGLATLIVHGIVPEIFRPLGYEVLMRAAEYTTVFVGVVITALGLYLTNRKERSELKPGSIKHPAQG